MTSDAYIPSQNEPLKQKSWQVLSDGRTMGHFENIFDLNWTWKYYTLGHGEGGRMVQVIM